MDFIHMYLAQHFMTLVSCGSCPYAHLSTMVELNLDIYGEFIRSNIMSTFMCVFIVQ